MTPGLREACRRAVHVVTADGRILRAGLASLHVLAGVGWPVAWMRWPPVSWLVELGYVLVARHRAAAARWLFRG